MFLIKSLVQNENNNMLKYLIKIAFTCDSGTIVLRSGHAPSCVCCQVDTTAGCSLYGS